MVGGRVFCIFGINERWGNPKERDHLEDIGVNGGIILIVSSKWDGRHGLDLSGSGLGQVVDTCGYSNKPSGSINCREFCCLAESILTFQEGIYCIDLVSFVCNLHKNI
jgi:hypothetical protein